MTEEATGAIMRGVSRTLPRLSLVATLVMGGLAEQSVAAPPQSSESDPLLEEVVSSLYASSVREISLDDLLRTGLNALHAEDDCLRVVKRESSLQLVCRGALHEAPWPPAGPKDVAHLLSSAVGITAAQGQTRIQLSERMARSLALSLGDPYTAYLSPAAVAKLDTALRSRLATAGIELQPTRPTVVREVRPGSDAARSGLRPGDRLLLIDGHPTEDRTYAELCELLIGPAESKVPVQYLRATSASQEPRVVTLTRTLLPEKAVYSVELPGDILYLRLAAFGPGVTRQMAAELWARPHQGVVLDLRHNPGGLVEEAVSLLDLFFDEGPIGGIAPRPGRTVEEYRARHQPSDVHAPVALLLDGGSASASELVAMVMQERGRAVLLGAPSLGKGSVQRIIRMPGGGVLKVTNAHYTGAKGKRLDLGGVQPDRYLGPPKGLTVLEGGDAAADSWVLSAIDVLEGGTRVGSQRIGPLVGPLP